MTSDAGTQKPVQRRNRQPVMAPKPPGTRLRRLPGITVWICKHETYGFHIATMNGKPIWSHRPDQIQLIIILDADVRRTASGWATESEARQFLLQTLSLSDWSGIEILKHTTDTGMSPSIHSISASPYRMCSVDSCCEAFGFEKLPIHRLDPKMT